MKKEACEVCTEYYAKNELYNLKEDGGYVCIYCVSNAKDEVACCEGCGEHYLFEQYPKRITDGYLDVCSPQCLQKHKMSVCTNCSMIDYNKHMKILDGKITCDKCVQGNTKETEKHKLEIHITKNLTEYIRKNPEYVKRTMSAIVNLNSSLTRKYGFTLAGHWNSAIRVPLNNKALVLITPVEVIYIVDGKPTVIYSAKNGDSLQNLNSLLKAYKNLEFITYIFDGRKDIKKFIEANKNKQ